MTEANGEDVIDLFEAFAGEAEALEGQLVASSVRANLFGGAHAAVRVGRFAVLEELGRGGMGVVHAAFDRTLDRKVAIKSILFSRASNEAARRRMTEEARSMAKLSHANVVHVYEVGEHDERVYIAMEYVDGPTLAKWLETPRRPEAILELFLAAGAGLLAAHRAGVIHRDFKPENVLLDAEGVPKVADFGLAGVESTDTPDSWSAAGITKTGDCIGTPRYMAPEQHRGRAATPASDQFSFCVALFEALSGTHPFLTEDLSDFIPAMESARVVTDTRRPIPRQLRPLLIRGLQHDPQSRFTTFEELLSALRATQDSKRTWLGFGLAAVSVGAIVTASMLETTEEPCVGVGESMGRVWSSSERTALETRFGGKGDVENAEQMSRHVDRYTESWVAARVDACMATHRGEQSERRLDLRMQCLDAQEVEFEVSLEVVHALAATDRLQALDTLDGLPSVDACEDGAALELRAPGDALAQHAEASALLRRRLATLKARLRAGQLDAARDETTAILAEAEQIGDERARAEAMSWLGWREAQSEAYARAEPRMREAYFTAAAAGLDEVAIGIAVDLANAEANDGTAEVAARWHEHAAAAVSRGRFENSDLDAYLQHSRGVLADVSGKHTDAVLHFRRALATLEALGAQPPRSDASSVHRSLGMALQALREHDEARAQLEKALELRRSNYGDRHPLTIRALSALGVLEYQVHNNEVAVERLEEAKSLAVATLGQRDIEVANLANNLSGPLLDLQRYDDAIAVLDEAASIYAEHEGHEDDLGIISINLGNTLRAQGQTDKARERYELAVKVLTEALGADDLLTLFARYGRAVCMIEQKEVEAGVADFDVVLALLETQGQDAFFLGGAYLERAELLAAAGEPELALESGRVALRHAQSDAAKTVELLPQIEAWLAEHGGGGSKSAELRKP